MRFVLCRLHVSISIMLKFDLVLHGNQNKDYSIINFLEIMGGSHNCGQEGFRGSHLL